MEQHMIRHAIQHYLPAAGRQVLLFFPFPVQLLISPYPLSFAPVEAYM